MTDTAPQEGSRVSVIAEAILADAALMHPHPDVEETTGLAYEAAERIDAALRTSTEGPTRVNDQEEVGQIIGLLTAGKAASGNAALREAVDCALDRLFSINNELRENR